MSEDKRAALEREIERRGRLWDSIQVHLEPVGSSVATGLQAVAIAEGFVGRFAVPIVFTGPMSR